MTAASIPRCVRRQAHIPTHEQQDRRRGGPGPRSTAAQHQHPERARGIYARVATPPGDRLPWLATARGCVDVAPRRYVRHAERSALEDSSDTDPIKRDYVDNHQL